MQLHFTMKRFVLLKCKEVVFLCRQKRQCRIDCTDREHCTIKTKQSKDWTGYVIYQADLYAAAENKNMQLNLIWNERYMNEPLEHYSAI